MLIMIGLLVGAHVAHAAYGPQPGTNQLVAQTAFLEQALDDGAAADMQRLFPEGSYFLRALTASAAAGAYEDDHERLRALRDGLDAPDSVAVFGSGMTPEHGIFQAGWALLVADDLAALTGDAADRADVERRATMINSALAASQTGFLEGYPQQFWPCDTVVAAAELARAAELLDRPEWLATLRQWMIMIEPVRDRGTGLLPHRISADGKIIEGPRGSSQAIIQSFWPVLTRIVEGGVDRASWQMFHDQFVVRVGGLVGVREFPIGTDGASDVDSGPLILGVSASASAVALAGARQVGDLETAEALDREAELLGIPLSWGGQRSFALGLLPVGDAFVAWARSRPVEPNDWVPIGSPAPWWPALVAAGLLPAALGVGLLILLRRRLIGSTLRPPLQR